ncbi:AraC family transcriptional regulator, mar-sox-rob regulon activator [Enterobacter ludwigii]|jgi:AraC family transcriptional activator of mar-sox-rob regulon|nr:AraC family transcriptional regulator [Enterobacter sp. BIDMC 26]SHL60936.1 AraC family transcriptional regulator, mar-sox-rob regulon activator [Enterobacter ludwigii]
MSERVIFKCNRQKCFLKRGVGETMNTDAFIHDLLDWIDNNLESRLDINTVSRRAGYSKWHLQRIFKEHTGYPLAEYIRAQKLQKSVERLTHSDEPILNVAIALGFDSQQSFNRSFKRQYGQAPGAWRRNTVCPERQQST